MSKHTAQVVPAALDFIVIECPQVQRTTRRASSQVATGAARSVTDSVTVRCPAAAGCDQLSRAATELMARHAERVCARARACLHALPHMAAVR
jgi:hypothetical protein